jgi:DNA polymerase I-like protein with 3'-5' exonuclease and polymerase domains
MREIMEVASTASATSVVCSFDYETTGMKPDKSGHSIYVVSIASSTTGNSFSFFLNDETRETFIEFLRHKNIWKVAHNHKFEARWSKKCLKTKVAKWAGDTMLIQHALDNRSGVTGLKYQVAIRYGDLDYAKLGGLGDWGDDANTVHSYERHDQNDLRLYNALDSLYTLWLYKDQIQEMIEVRKTFGKHQLMRGQAASFAEGMKLTMDTSATFQLMEENGMKVDMQYLGKCDAKLGVMIYEAREEFLKTKVAREWRKRYGVVNVNSPVQLRNVLYKYLGFEPPKQTDNDEDATDKEALLTLNDPELIKLIDLKKLCKARGTYVRQIQREVVDTVIHTSFSLNIARTGRSSSQFPNMQNIPVRDKVVGTIIRTIFIPFTPEDHVVEVDLKGAEVGTAACYNQDPKLIKYVADPTLDMHRDIVERIFGVKRDWITKEIRYCGKNMFVFPQFYGASGDNCAKALWHASGNLFVGPDKVPMRIWLKKQGIKNNVDFDAHIKGVVRYFWEEMFSVYTEWKEEWWQSYLQMGYVDTFTGFRCSMLMDKRKAINYPIQGDAFRLEAWIANRVRAKLRDLEGPIRKVKLMNLIHDSLLSNVPAMCLTQFVDLVQETVAEVRKYHSWINVPITAEVEVAPMGKPWINKEPYKLGKVA